MFFRMPKELLKQEDKVYILDIKRADVNGDGLDETLMLTGKKPYGENGFIEDIILTVVNKKTNVNIKVIPKDNAGYVPTLFIGRFEQDNTPEILLSIASGGSADYYFNYIYSFKDNVTKVIFDYNQFSDKPS